MKKELTKMEREVIVNRLIDKVKCFNSQKPIGFLAEIQEKEIELVKSYLINNSIYEEADDIDIFNLEQNRKLIPVIPRKKEYIIDGISYNGIKAAKILKCSISSIYSKFINRPNGYAITINDKVIILRLS